MNAGMDVPVGCARRLSAGAIPVQRHVGIGPVDVIDRVIPAYFVRDRLQSVRR